MVRNSRLTHSHIPALIEFGLKNASGGKSRPIIIVPASYLAGNLDLTNSKSFLQDG